MTIETIEAGEVLGWSWLFPPYRWHFDARALAPVRATAFDGDPTFWTPTRNNRLDYLFYKNGTTILDAAGAHIPPRNTAL